MLVMWLVTKIKIVSPTHLVANIRHLHRCNPISTVIPKTFWLHEMFDFFTHEIFKNFRKFFFAACQNLIVYIWVSAGSGATDVSLFTDLIFTIWGLSQPTISVQWLIDKQCDSCFVTHTLWLIQLVCLLYRIYNFPQTSSVYTCIKYLPK